MRVSTQPEDRGFAAWRAAKKRGVTYDVFLNGALLHGVITADNKTGFVTTVQYAADGKSVVINSSRTGCKMIRRHGSVEIRAVRL